MKIFTKNIILLFAFLLLANLQLSAQENITWSILADVKFKKQFSEELGMSIDSAIFGDQVKTFEGKEVIITGYMIPLDALGISYVISKNTNANCFFCGGAGPETVIELEMKPGAIRRYKTDEMQTFKGKLQMNKTNEDQLTYVLLEAEPL